ncbi:MAG: hypothetical protein IT423_04085, partial [Pirellulaceae bacterium]|nr:hypothetical protein [Pirellulaceae bacterium]
MAKDPDSGSMSEESISFLEEVKKGKPRKFAMICKGTSVVSLVVYKKGNVEKRKKEAKESGKGQFYHGVVDGKGINIRFVLARADGFEDAPVKTTILKSYLEEAADFKCKPVFEIVDSAPDVLDEDDPLVARFLALKKSAELASQTHPDRAGELSSLCETTRQHLLQEQTEQATTSVQTLETLLSQLGNAAGSNAGPNAGAPAADAPNSELEDEIPPPPPPPPPPSESTPKPSRTDEALRLKLQEALNKFIPQLKELVAASPERKTELLSPVAAAKKQLDAGELNAAKQSILAIGTMLKSLVANQQQAGQDPSAGNAPPSALQVEYQSKLQE